MDIPFPCRHLRPLPCGLGVFACLLTLLSVDATIWSLVLFPISVCFVFLFSFAFYVLPLGTISCFSPRYVFLVDWMGYSWLSGCLVVWRKTLSPTKDYGRECMGSICNRDGQAFDSYVQYSRQRSKTNGLQGCS